jgi:hypothetical protein
MRARRPGVNASDVISDELKEVLRRLAEKRASASQPIGRNPAIKG